MRKLIIAATSIAALAVPAVATSLASAAVPVSPITVTPYHVTYGDSEWGPISCDGLHTVVTGKLASTTDTFTCVSTTGKALTGLKPLQHVTLATVGGWGSDYSGTDGGMFWYGKTAKSLDGLVSLNGKSIAAVAAY